MKKSILPVTADNSVDYPRGAENDRSVHLDRVVGGKNAATTEDLRTAMVYYRSLFEELVQVPAAVEWNEAA